MSEIDIFVSSMSIITLDHMKSLENSTLDGNTGHSDNVIDLVGSEGFGENIKPQVFYSCQGGGVPAFAIRHGSLLHEESLMQLFLFGGTRAWSISSWTR